MLLCRYLAIFKRSSNWILKLSDVSAVILFKAYNLSAASSLNIMGQLSLLWTILLGNNAEELQIIVCHNDIFSWSLTRMSIIIFSHSPSKARLFSADTSAYSKRYFIAEPTSTKPSSKYFFLFVSHSLFLFFFF